MMFWPEGQKSLRPRAVFQKTLTIGRGCDKIPFNKENREFSPYLGDASEVEVQKEV